MVTGRVFWIPFIVGLLVLAYLKLNWRVIFVFLFFGIVVALGDRISVQLFKEVFERLRPCHNPLIKDVVHTVYEHCGGKFGFVSSHATNSFALAVFSGMIFRKSFRFVMLIMLFWAVLVSYSRIYVGVHFPLDIICGALLGVGIAFFVFWLFKFANQKLKLKLDKL